MKPAMNQNTAQMMMVTGLVAFFSALGVELAKLDSWAQAATPSFVGTTLIQVFGALASVYGARNLHTTRRR